MKKTAGYFFEASNPGGFTTHAWSVRPSADFVLRCETSPISTCAIRESLACVIAAAPLPPGPANQPSAGLERVEEEKKILFPSLDATSPDAEPPRQISEDPPSRPTRRIVPRAPECETT